MPTNRTRRTRSTRRPQRSDSPKVPMTGFAILGLVTTLLTVLCVGLFALVVAWFGGMTPDPNATQAEITANHLEAAAAAGPFQLYALALAIAAVGAVARRSTVFALITVGLLLVPVGIELRQRGIGSALDILPYFTLQIFGFLIAITMWIEHRRKQRCSSPATERPHHGRGAARRSESGSCRL